MSIDELFYYIKEALTGCSGYAFIDKVLEELREVIAPRENFECEKFYEWFKDRNVAFKSSPISFLRKCGIEDIKNGVFDKEIVTSFMLHPMCIDMKNRDIEFRDRDIAYVNVYITYIYNNRLMSKEEIKEWLHNAVEYISEHSKSALEFRHLFVKSKSMKRLNLPYLRLDEEAKRDTAEWEKIIKELDTNPEQDPLAIK